MIQDIAPSELHNHFTGEHIQPHDRLLCFDQDGRIFVNVQNGCIRFPDGSQAAGVQTVYAFSVDDDRYFIALPKGGCSDDSFTYMTIRELRDCGSGKELFAAFTGYHLWRWYADNVFCGRCGAIMLKGAPVSAQSGARFCTSCGAPAGEGLFCTRCGARLQ